MYAFPSQGLIYTQYEYLTGSFSLRLQERTLNTIDIRRYGDLIATTGRDECINVYNAASGLCVIAIRFLPTSFDLALTFCDFGDFLGTLIA